MSTKRNISDVYRDSTGSARPRKRPAQDAASSRITQEEIYEFESEPSLTGAIKPVRPLADRTNIKTYKKNKQQKRLLKRRKKEEKTEDSAPSSPQVVIIDSSDDGDDGEGDLAVIIDSSENSGRFSDGPFATSTPVNETLQEDRKSSSKNPVGEATQLLDQVKEDREGRHGKYTGLYMLKQNQPLQDLSKHESEESTDSDDLLL